MNRRLRRDVAWNLVPLVLLGVVGLGLNIVIAAWWGAAALGVFNLVTIAYFVLAVVGAFGLQFSVLRATAERPEDRDHVAAVAVGALVPNLVMATLATAVFVATRDVLGDLLGSNQVAEGMAWAAPGLFCFAINKVLLGIVNGLRRMRAFAIYTSLRYVLIAVGIVIARMEDVGASHLAGLWTLAEGVLFVVLLGELLATVSLHRAGHWRHWARVHLAFGVRGLPASLAYEINTKLDVWMLGAAGISKTQVGIYSLAAALNEGATQLSVVVQNNLNPLLSRGLADGERGQVDTLVHSTRRWFVPAMAAACVLGAVAFPFAIPRLLGDPAFATGALPFANLMAGLAIASPWLPFNQILLMANRPGWHAIFVVTVVSLNFIGDLLLIPSFGLAGAAIATAFAVIGSALLLRVLARATIAVRL